MKDNNGRTCLSLTATRDGRSVRATAKGSAGSRALREAAVELASALGGDVQSSPSVVVYGVAENGKGTAKAMAPLRGSLDARLEVRLFGPLS